MNIVGRGVEALVRVLFVCLGNICRSPMAEALFRHKVKEAGLEDRIEVDSAGTGDWHIGSPPHHGTRRILDQYRISYEGIAARQITPKDFHHYQYIVAMDRSNLANLSRIAPASHQAEIKLMMDYVGNAAVKEVPDPYYTGNFEEVYELLEEGCTRLLEHIRQREGL